LVARGAVAGELYEIDLMQFESQFAHADALEIQDRGDTLGHTIGQFHDAAGNFARGVGFGLIDGL
jgi:hypothetical protein